jgi:hypothetical protein
VLVGTVRDARGRPLRDARASVEEAAGEALTNDAGRFLLAGLPSGTQTLEVRLLGFGAARVPVELRNRDTAAVEVVLQQATVLGAVRVVVPRAALRLAEAEQRRRAGLGYHLTEAEIKRHVTVRSLFADIPDVITRGRSVYDFQIWLNGTGQPCPALLYIDGIETSVAHLVTFKPADLLEVEVYPRGATAPARYTMLRGTCGVVLVWTRALR